MSVISKATEVDSQMADILANLSLDDVMEAKEIFDSVMQAYPASLGKAVSKKERDERKLKDATLVYGEITFNTLGLVFEKIKKVYGLPNKFFNGPQGMMQKQGGIFYDLGSGTGKAVIGAAILHNFDKCCGIEILEGLYNVSIDAVDAYNTRGKAKLEREYDTKCEMVHGSFCALRLKDWRDADVVFINSTCYDEILMAKIAEIAAGMKKGSFIISLTKRLPSMDFKVLEYEMYRMSWGEATIFIMQKTNDPRSEEEEDDVLFN